MKLLSGPLLSLAFALPAMAQEGRASGFASPTQSDISTVSPALDRYQQSVLFEDLWKRQGLSARDRSIVTVAALVSRNQAIELPRYLNLALDSGVKPAEISEIITHLAFYSGWANAMMAVAVTKDIFAQRGVKADQLPAASPKLLPLNEAAENARAKLVQETVGPVSQGVVDYTGNVLFKDLWLRPDLAPRDRSLVTVTALIANGQVGQIPYHLGRAMDNGLTKDEASEVLAHLPFYTGWPNVFSALPVVQKVFESRPK